MLEQSEILNRSCVICSMHRGESLQETDQNIFNYLLFTHIQQISIFISVCIKYLSSISVFKLWTWHCNRHPKFITFLIFFSLSCLFFQDRQLLQRFFMKFKQNVLLNVHCSLPTPPIDPTIALLDPKLSKHYQAGRVYFDLWL